MSWFIDFTYFVNTRNITDIRFIYFHTNKYTTILRGDVTFNLDKKIYPHLKLHNRRAIPISSCNVYTFNRKIVFSDWPAFFELVAFSF